MRCSQCGLPLSPTRSSSNCPRCGAPVSANTADQAKVESTPLQTNAFAPGSPYQFSPVNPFTNVNQSNPAVPTMANNMYVPPTPNWNDVNNFQNPGSPPTPFSPAQSPQMPFPPSENRQNMFSSGPEQQVNMQPATFPMADSSPLPPSYATNTMQNRQGQPFPRNPYPATRGRSKTTRIGFTVAGLCILAGGFLLTFVYFIGQGLLPDGGAATTANTTQPSITAVAHSQPTPTIVPTPTTTAVTQTPTLPGQNLLDTSVLGTGVNPQTGQIVQQSTSFQVNQKIYVVLSLHPGGNIHTVCLNWYLNDQSVNTFSFEVNPASNYNYYSYASIGTAGNGRVEISLASTTSCVDATMAQKLSFTVL
jgi:hypothetical protein